MNRVFALTVVMSINAYAASPTPDKSPSYNDLYSEKLRLKCDQIDLNLETHESLPTKIRCYLVRYGYIREETEDSDANTLIKAVWTHLQDKWWATHSRIKRAEK